MDNLIVNFTPTGMVPTKITTPHVPISPREIIQEVKAACELGITIVHLHARDENGLPTNNLDIWKEIIYGIRCASEDLIICVSLSGRTNPEYEYRVSPALLEGDFKPDMGSLTLSSLNFTQQASINSPDTIFKLALMMKDRGIYPELEIFDLGMVNYAKYLINKHVLKPNSYANIILGNIATAQINNASTIIDMLPTSMVWSMGGIGKTQLPANMMAIALEGGVRIGLEDNIYFDYDKKSLATNFQLISRILMMASLCGRVVMPSTKFRQLMLR